MDKLRKKPSCQPWSYAPIPTKLSTGECTSCMFYDGVDDVCTAFEFSRQERSAVRHLCTMRYGAIHLYELEGDDLHYV